MNDNAQLPLDGDFIQPLEDKARRERLKEIKARYAHANPGPWIVEKGGYTGAKGFAGDAEDDAQFVAHARQDVPWLVEQIEKLMEARHE